MPSVAPRSVAVSALAIMRSDRPSPAKAPSTGLITADMAAMVVMAAAADYGGGYYGGGGVYYGDADYGYGYGGYYDNYAAGVPAAYSALTYPPNYDQSYGRIYQVPTAVCPPAVRTSYVSVTTYQAQPHIIYLPTTQSRAARGPRDRETGY